MPAPTLRDQLPRFAAIGGIGFLVDATVLTALVNGYGMGPIGARGISFGAAATVTWYLNRRWTFAADASDRRGPEYARYVTAQVLGALINLLVYLLVIRLVPELGALPVIPLAAGAVIALLFNFAAARYWVFAAPGSRS